MLKVFNFAVICNKTMDAQIVTQSVDAEKRIARSVTKMSNVLSSVMHPFATYNFRHVCNDKNYQFYNCISTTMTDDAKQDYSIIAGLVFCIYQRSIKSIYVSDHGLYKITDAEIELIEKIAQRELTDHELSEIVKHITSLIKSLSRLKNSVVVALYRGEQETGLFELDGGNDTTRVDGLFDDPNHVPRIKHEHGRIEIDYNKFTFILKIGNRRLQCSFPVQKTLQDLDKILKKLLSVDLIFEIDVNRKPDGTYDVYSVCYDFPDDNNDAFNV